MARLISRSMTSVEGSNKSTYRHLLIHDNIICLQQWGNASHSKNRSLIKEAYKARVISFLSVGYGAELDSFNSQI